jgi:hypothetical protein
VGQRFADVNIVNRVPHDGGGIMVWAGINYRQLTVLPWPAYSDLSPTEQVWDALDRHVRVPANIQQLRTAIEEERDNIPQVNQQPDQLHAKEMCHIYFSVCDIATHKDKPQLKFLIQ